MAQITVDTQSHDPADAEDRRELLRSVLPAAAAVLLLLGVVVAGGLWLREMLDFGVWFLSSR